VALLTAVSSSHGLGFWEEPMLAPTDADGNFRLPPVYPGAYRLSVRVRPPYYLNVMRLGEAEPAAPEMGLTSETMPITLVYKTNGSTVRGTVEKCALGQVMLVPQDPARWWPGFVQTARCDSNNHYQIAGVRPGEYYAVAYSEDTYSPSSSYEFWMPNIENGILSQASRITARSGETTLVDLRANTQPTY